MSEQNQQTDAELSKVAREVFRDWEDEDQKLRDYKHRRQINQAIVASLTSVTGVSEEHAKRIVKAIACGEIGHVSIAY